VIFFARYEASQYGSHSIELEHLLLGVAREDSALFHRLMGSTYVGGEIRHEIEKHITQRERIATSLDVPLSTDSKNALRFAAEESERLGHRHIETAHLLLGILRVEGSLAARILLEKGLTPEAIQQQIGNPSGSAFVGSLEEPKSGAMNALNAFLSVVKQPEGSQPASSFAVNAHFIDSAGKLWIGRESIEKRTGDLLAPYAKKNAAYVIEGTYWGPGGSLLASIVWENVIFGAEIAKSMHRMTVILAREDDVWVIFLLQVTPIVGG
jgi:ATP-dependent Clp protease ATP-binding subunit ClpA